MAISSKLRTHRTHALLLLLRRITERTTWATPVVALPVRAGLIRIGCGPKPILALCETSRTHSSVRCPLETVSLYRTEPSPAAPDFGSLAAFRRAVRYGKGGPRRPWRDKSSFGGSSPLLCLGRPGPPLAWIGGCRYARNPTEPPSVEGPAGSNGCDSPPENALMVLDYDPPTVARYVSKLTTVNLDTYLAAVLISRQRYRIAPEPAPSLVENAESRRSAPRDFRSVAPARLSLSCQSHRLHPPWRTGRITCARPDANLHSTGKVSVDTIDFSFTPCMNASPWSF